MTAKVIVTAVGLLLVGWVNWYFLFSRRRKSGPKAGHEKPVLRASAGKGKDQAEPAA